jgi:N-acyl-D-amino-acid deacylase
MNKRNLALFSILLLLSVGFTRAQPSPEKIKTIDSVLSNLHERGMFNGVVLLADRGKVIYQQSLGVSDIETNEKLATTSSFNLASVSKQFMSMMTMILKERGKLNYDDKVQKHLPAFPYPSITVKNLLTHTSGLPEYFDLSIKYNNTLDTLNNEKLIQLLAKYLPPLVFEPGARWQYCNTGYVVLASVIQAAAGMRVEDFFRATITKPLGLKHTFIHYLNMPVATTAGQQRVFGFERKNGKNKLNDLVRLDGVVGDGNVYSSAQDLLKWDQTLYTAKLVSAASLKEAFTPVKLNDGSTYNYGFGWAIENNGKKLAHTGGWVGFRTAIERNIEKKTTLIFLSSSSEGIAYPTINQVLMEKPPKMPNTHLVSNVRIIDGTGNASVNGSVRIKDNKIWEMGDLTPFPGEAVTDGKGLVLAPGFIDSHSHHFGGLQNAPEGIPALSQGITTIVIGQDGGSYAMDTLAGLIKKRPIAINVASYTGHSSLREEAMGENNLYRIAEKPELDKMKALLKREMKNGSLGLSTGLEYEQAFYSNRDEVLELAKLTAEYNGRYISHIRSEDVNLDEALEEIILIGRDAKIPVQISHIKIAKKDRWGQSIQLLAQLQQARSEGINITADAYPYDFWNSTIRVLFPNRDYNNLKSAEFAVNQLFDANKSVMVYFAPIPGYAGKTVGAIAKERNESPAQTLMNLVAIAEDYTKKHPDNSGGVEAIMAKSMDEKDVANFLAWPQTNICSDGSSGGHPRGYGTFTRVLGRYVREQKIMPLETAIYKMTGLTAEHLGITDRGLISPGNYADLVLFNPETVTDNADIKNGKALSTGIEMVWVNGDLVYEAQKATGKFPGVLIKKPGD